MFGTRLFKISGALITAGLAIVSVSAAFADQCDYLESNQAQKALQYIQPGAVLLHNCEMCMGNDASLMTVATVQSDVKPGMPGDKIQYTAITANGTELDLAYTFLKVDSVYINLSKIVDCRSQGVSPFLTQKDVDALLATH
jgi:hypothetical protein